MPFEAAFKLNAPCGNCPFRKEGAIRLRDGRLEGIIDDLLADDTLNFHCHKTVHHKRTAGTWMSDGAYKPSGEEAFCAGALIYLEKCQQPSVLMRMGRVLGKYDPAQLEGAFDQVIDPPDSPAKPDLLGPQPEREPPSQVRDELGTRDDGRNLAPIGAVRATRKAERKK